MRWHKWVVLTTEIDPALHYVLFALSNLHITPRVRRVPCIAHPGHHGPGHSRDLVGKRDGRDLCRPPRQQCREPGPVLGAVDPGIADDTTRAVANIGPTPGIASSRLLASLDRCQAMITRSNSKICSLSLRS